jgi:putrescine transport system ATP-binding protein
MTGEALLSIRNLSKRFGSVVALDDVSFEVAAGEFFALLGPSGCGKTTLMRVVAGFEPPDAGGVSLSGRDLAGEPPYRRPVNMMFQSYALFPHLNVAANIAYGLERQGKRREEIAARVEELLHIVQMSGFGERRIDQLSGGQKQRVALARALAPGPSLLLLDEPLGALDRKLREDTQFQLKDIQRRLNTSFVVVTHDQDEAMALADRIAVMRAGRIEQIGAPADIYRRPRTRFVASFVGQTNMIDGVVRKDGGGDWFETPFGRIAVAQSGFDDGAKASLSVRPENVRLARGASEGGIAGVADDAAFRGESTLLRVRVEGGAPLLVSCANGERFEKGDAVVLRIDPDDVTLFGDDA